MQARETLEAVAADPIGWIEKFVSARDSELEQVAEAISGMGAEARRAGYAKEAEWAKLALDLLGMEQANRDTIRNAEKSWRAEVKTLPLAALVRNIEAFETNVATLRAGSGYSDVMDPAARIHELCAGLCRAEAKARGKWFGQGNAPEWTV